MKRDNSGMNLGKAIIAVLLVGPVQPAVAAADLWVTADRVERRTCPDTTCGVVGQLFFRGGVSILEERDGWGRISGYYNASCNNGISGYVDFGNAVCTESNGIVDGRFAEWILMDHLSATRPPDPGAGATGDYALVKDSDDYRLYKDVFAKAAADLIKNGKCTAAQFRDNGGWWKSPKPGPIYFTYCGETTEKFHLNAVTGDVYR